MKFTQVFSVMDKKTTQIKLWHLFSSISVVFLAISVFFFCHSILCFVSFFVWLPFVFETNETRIRKLFKYGMHMLPVADRREKGGGWFESNNGRLSNVKMRLFAFYVRSSCQRSIRRLHALNLNTSNNTMNGMSNLEQIPTQNDFAIPRPYFNQTELIRHLPTLSHLSKRLIYFDMDRQRWIYVWL